MTNGPVLAQMNPFTDILTYSEGVYSRTSEAFRFQGNQIFKIVGWESTFDGSSAWIVENTWGQDWGTDGYARIASNGETALDFYALSFIMFPQTMADYQMQQMAQQQQQFDLNQFQDMDDLDGDIDQIFMDDEEFGAILEEGIDQEL